MILRRTTLSLCQAMPTPASVSQCHLQTVDLELQFVFFLSVEAGNANAIALAFPASTDEK